ncbi:hypothetical protein FACS1894126_1650 [Alphaproteobacteria bacterium]|nr:hypothetical protein FACS1894126_1650 [Alphaproteobacteria bacterium]
MKNKTPLISDDLLKLIVCPLSGIRLEISGDMLVNTKDSICYPIIDGIPVVDPKCVIKIEQQEDLVHSQTYD